jgi:hypothetical protein
MDAGRFQISGGDADMKYIFPLIIVHFIPGSASDMPAYVGGIFDNKEDCCYAYHALMDRKQSSILAVCSQISRELYSEEHSQAKLPQPVQC